jgi:hypothetical protein
MQKLFEKSELEKQGYSVPIKGFITILEPKNLTEQTSGIITFGREVEVDVDKEIGEMIEDRVLPQVS